MRKQKSGKLKRKPARAKASVIEHGPSKREVGAAIREFRRAHSLPASELSRICGLSSPRVIYAMESGQFKASHEIVIKLANMAAEKGDWTSLNRFLSLLEIERRTVNVLADSVRSSLQRSANLNYAVESVDGTETRDMPSWLVSSPASTRFQRMAVPLASDFFRPGDIVVIDGHVTAPEKLVGEIVATSVGGDPAIGILESEEDSVFGRTHYFLHRYDEARLLKIPIALREEGSQVLVKRALLGRVIAWFPAERNAVKEEK